MRRRQTVKQKEAEINRLNESIGDLELYIKDLSDFLPIAVCSLSPVTIVIDVNYAFEKISGYSLTEAAGRPMEFFFFDKEKVRAALGRLVKNGYLENAELTLLAKNGQHLPVNIIASTRKDQNNNLTGYFLALLDISEQKKFQEKLESEVKEKTKKLQEQVDELERINRLTIGRELKMVELKKEIEQLKEKANRVC